MERAESRASPEDCATVAISHLVLSPKPKELLDDVAYKKTGNVSINSVIRLSSIDPWELDVVELPSEEYPGTSLQDAD